MTVIRKKFGNNVYVYQVVSHKWHYLGKEKPINEWLNKVHCGNAYELLPLMPSESVDCVITSPPYYGLRTYDVETIFGGNPSCEHEWSEESVGRTDYTGFERSRRSLNKTAEVLDGHPRFTTSQPPPVEKKSHFCVKCGAWKGQLGLEPSWQMYVEHLVELFREVKRVLKKTGSLWLNIGDTYASKSINWTEEYANKPQWHPKEPIQRGISGYQPKCLMGIPWRVAFALIDDGWILRNAVIWYKPNHMPSSVKDRLTQTYEYIFHFVKSRKYYYNLDNIREPHKTTFAPFNLRVRDVKRGKGGVSAFGPLKASEEEIKNYVYPEKPNYDSKYKDAQSLQGFARSQSIAIRRALSRIEAKILFPNDPEKQQEYINYIHDHDGHPLGKNPGDFISTNSKFLHADVKTASPGARALRIILSGKLTTQVKQRILDVGAYLKAKLRESGLSMKELAEMTGIKQTTLEHYFRTDFSGQAIPDRETWNLLKPILKLGEYDDYINEEIRSALPQPHPLGKNPGDVLSLATQSYHGAHFAVFPVDLPLRPILASCPPDGIVLDPLAGSGTVGETCELINHGMWDKFRLYVNETAKKQKWSLKWILIDVNPQYCELARKRLAPYVNNLETYF